MAPTTAPTRSSLLALLTAITALLINPIKSQVVFLPDCANQCYLSALSGTFGCASTDIQCFCTPPGSTKYLNCVQAACDSAGVSQFEAYGKQNCGIYGFTAGVSAAVASATVASGNSPAVTSAPAVSISSPLFGSNGGATTLVVTRSSGAGAGATTVAVSATGSGSGAVTTEIVIQQPASSGGGGGLSTGAKAGIGAGVGVGGAALLVVLGVLAWKLRGKRRREAVGAGVLGAGAGGGAGMGEVGGAGSAVGAGANGNGGVSYVPSSTGGEGGEWTKIESEAAEVDGSSGLAPGTQGQGSELESHDGQGHGAGNTML